MQLRKHGVNMEQEDDTSGFIVAALGCDEATGLTEMKQVVLINRVLETLG